MIADPDPTVVLTIPYITVLLCLLCTVHPQNVQLLNVQLQNVQLPNVKLQDVQLQDVM
jgi:hypothetical protein